MRRLTMMFLGLTVAILAGCGHEPARTDSSTSQIPTRKVILAPVEKTSTGSYDELMGTVVARNRADIETKFQARVERIPVVLGSHVRKGDMLAELDTRELRARVQQARAVSEQTALDLTRFERLISQQAVTQQEYEAVKARKAVAEANLQEAEAVLSYSQIVAPFSGVVTDRNIDIGDLAVPGKPLFGLEEDGAPRLVVTIPESRLNALAIGSELKVVIPSADTIVQGRVEELAPSADPVSRSFTAKIGLPAHTRILPGQFGKLILPSLDGESLFIPTAAVVHRGQLELVYVFTADNKASLRMIRTGRRIGDQIEVLSGLHESERVVISAPAELSDGDALEAQL